MSIYIKGERYICPDCKKSYAWNWVNRHLVSVHDYLWWDNERVCKAPQLHNPTGPIYPEKKAEATNE